MIMKTMLQRSSIHC